MKKIIGYLPMWILYHIGSSFDAYDTVHDKDTFGWLTSWCMINSLKIQNWSGLENPWFEPEPKKNLEIERRWIMKYLPDLEYDEILAIIQYYTPTGRYRVTCNVNTHDNIKFYHTIKKIVSYGINEEDEKEITETEFNEAVKTATSKITKSRHKYKHSGLTFEFDGLILDPVLTDPTLYIMEIELNDIKQVINIPVEINKVIIKEITGDKVFSNHALSTKI